VEFPTWMIKLAKSGTLTISRNEIKAVQIRLKEKSLDLNIIDKKFLKEVLESGSKSGSLRDLVKLIRELSESLKDEGYTITVSYLGTVVLALGSEASSRVFNLVAGLDGFEVRNFGKLLQLAL